MKKMFVFLLVLTLVSFSCSKTEKRSNEGGAVAILETSKPVVQDQVFGNMGYLCVVVGNTVKWYDPDNNYNERTSLAFNLQKGYKSVFGNMGYLCVVVDNTVKWYDPDNNRIYSNIFKYF